MPETLSSPQGEQESIESQQGADTANELLNTRSEMSSDKSVVQAELKTIRQQLEEAKNRGDEQSTARLDFERLAHEAQLDALAVEEEQKSD